MHCCENHEHMTPKLTNNNMILRSAYYMFFNVSEIMDHTRYAYIYIFTPMTATYINTINNVCHKTHTRAHLREIEKKKTRQTRNIHIAKSTLHLRSRHSQNNQLV